MKKVLGYFLLITGSIFVVISILALVQAFNLFSAADQEKKGYAYVFGSIFFPLLLTVLGRWLYRAGRQNIRN
jgi:hypothetical protein